MKSSPLSSSISAPERRGNTIVLVTGILVLLVIIATAYVSRTQAGRTTATAATTAGLRLDLQQVIADMLAEEISGANFVKPLNGGGLFDPNFSANSDFTRVLPGINAVRHGIDPNFPYNYAPYEVVPWTNWPDAVWNIPGGTFALANPTFWPTGAGNPNPFMPTLYWLAAEGNPFGNPGFGDTRWLRSFEPLRYDIDGDLIDDTFSHWRHMTNIARADNGWRVCIDISDIEGWGVVDNLNIPIEQWTIFRPPGANTTTGHYALLNDFETLWNNWFTLPGYEAALQDPNLAPINFLKLDDLDGNGQSHTFGDFPDDEFFFGSARNRVGRRLADTDGDGFTDSFWFLAPSPLQSGIRTVVAISVVDNCAMLDVNAATRFIENDLITLPAGPKKTTGATPADLAFVGQLINGNLASNFNVGFYDNPDHDNNGFASTFFGTGQFDYLGGTRWSRHLTEVGLPSPANFMLTAADRLDYWLRAGSRPASDIVPSRYTPFTLSDEIELRSFWGRNTPWNFSRYEHSVQAEGSNVDEGFLRANKTREESSEFGSLNPPMPNRMFVVDQRHRLTMYSAARNDIMPPYLWMYRQDFDLNNDGVINAADDAIFHRGMLKFDLRQPFGVRIDVDINNDGFISPFTSAIGQIIEESLVTANPNVAGYVGRRDVLARLGEYLRDRFEIALMDDPELTPNPLFVNPPPTSYYGNTPQARDQTRELAAALAAQYLARRDRELGNIQEQSTLNDSVAISPLEVPDPLVPTPRMMGLEPQPFLMEAFIGHVYKGVIIPDEDLEGDPYLNAGGYVVLEEDPLAGSGGNRRSTIVAVQIANPFDTQINLAGYEISAFGQAYVIPNLTLPPATEERPSTAIFYAINEAFDQDQNIDPPPSPNPPGDPSMLLFGTRWMHFLSLLPADLNLTGSIAQDVAGAWSSTNRGVYDTNDTGIELRRSDPIDPTVKVVIDRFDDPTEPDAQKFAEAVNELGATPLDVEPNPLNTPDVPPVGAPYPLGIPLEPNGPETGNRFRHWVQWARVTRAWASDCNDDGVYDQNEKSPRFVFGDKAITTARETALPTGTLVANGNKYRFDDPPDLFDPNVDPPITSLWFSRDYVAPDGLIRTSKPTFFSMRSRDPNISIAPIANFPDKGWYGQNGGVDTTPIGPNRLDFPFQMLHKDGEYEQVGEILNTLTFGHKIDAVDSSQSATGLDVTYTKTVKTFSEYLTDNALSGGGLNVNRLQANDAGGNQGKRIGIGNPLNIFDPRHSYPDLPAGARLIDGLVCDGPGLTGTYGIDNYNNAKGLEGDGTPALININTTPLEVMRSGPHMYRAVHEEGWMQFSPPNFTDPMPGNSLLFNSTPVNPAQPLVTAGAANPTAMMPRVMVPEAMIQYRERYNGLFIGPFVSGIAGGPNYELRSGARGFSGIGEVMSLMAPGSQPNPNPYLTYSVNAPNDYVQPPQWRIDLGLTDLTAGTPRPFVDSVDPATRKPVSLRLSTDRIDSYNPRDLTKLTRDLVAGDAEEANMLFAGISNLITTRSDTFTVYFKVRSFRQNTSVSPPVWDATNKDYIVDDSRYVMLVDRSNVNKPGDKPRILYLEKLPN